MRRLGSSSCVLRPTLMSHVLFMHMALCSHQPFRWTFEYSLSFKRCIYAYIHCKVWDNLHTSIAKCLVHYGSHILGLGSFEGAQLLSWPHLIDCTSTPPISKRIWFVKDLVWRVKHGIVRCIVSSNVVLWRSKGYFMPIILFFLQAHLPMFWDPMGISHFNLKICSWNFHNQHRVKCTQHNTFIDLGSWGVTWHTNFNAKLDQMMSTSEFYHEPQREIHVIRNPQHLSYSTSICAIRWTHANSLTLHTILIFITIITKCASFFFIMNK